MTREGQTGHQPTNNKPKPMPGFVASLCTDIWPGGRSELRPPLYTRLTWSHQVDWLSELLAWLSNITGDFYSDEKKDKMGANDIKSAGSFWRDLHTVKQTSHVSRSAGMQTYCDDINKCKHVWKHVWEQGGKSALAHKWWDKFGDSSSSHSRLQFPYALYICWQYRTMYFWAGCQQSSRVRLSQTLTVFNS